jgi:hypothetical protein
MQTVGLTQPTIYHSELFKWIPFYTISHTPKKRIVLFARAT